MIVEWEDLAGRTCPVCGAVMGDVVGHRRWHHEQDAVAEAAMNVLRGVVEITDALRGVVEITGVDP